MKHKQLQIIYQYVIYMIEVVEVASSSPCVVPWYGGW